MERTIAIDGLFSLKVRAFAQSVLQVVLGNLFLIACAKLSVPLQPVPMSLQSFAIFVLAVTLGGKKGFFAVLCYLIEATLGLPVLASKVNPLWLFGPTAGYLISYPFAAYFMGKMIHARQEISSLWVVFTFFCGKLLIYSLGVIALSRFVGWQQSVVLGVYPFMALAGLKVLSAALFCGIWIRWKSRFNLTN
ncbi:MAG: biotin transporter BioY [Simkania negevensis]|nr:biotin transporter BioY [Simkania negevensis]